MIRRSKMRGSLGTLGLFPDIGDCSVYRDKKLHVAKVSAKLVDVEITLRKAETRNNITFFNLELVFEEKGILFSRLFLLIKEVDECASDEEKLSDRDDAHYVINVSVRPKELEKLIDLLKFFSAQDELKLTYLLATGKAGG